MNQKIKDKKRGSFRLPRFGWKLRVFLFALLILWVIVIILNGGQDISDEDHVPDREEENLSGEILHESPESFSQTREIPPEIQRLLLLTEYENHTVEPEDTIESIALAYQRKVETILAFNRSQSIRVGQVLKIPMIEGVSYRVQSGDTLGKIGRDHGVRWQDIVDANHIDQGVIITGQDLFIPMISEAQEP